MKGKAYSILLFVGILAILVSAVVSTVAAQEDRALCDNLYNSSDYEAAAECYLTLEPPDYWWASDSYGWAGNIAMQEGDYTTALAYYQLEIQYANLTTSHQRMGPAYYHGGQASYALGNYENAKNYYLQAGDHYVQVPDYWWAGDSYSWAGNIAYEQGEYDAAIYYYLLSAQNFLGIPDYKRTGDAYHGAGNSASTKGDCPKACCMYWGEAKYYYDLAEYDYNIPPICDQVMVWTGGDGTDGHFISEWNGWEERASAILTVHVRVLEGDQPVEEAEIFFQGISQGQTDNNGHLRFLFPIIAIDPIMTGPLVTTVEARWNGISAVSEPTLIYESKCLRKCMKSRFLSDN